MIELQKNAFFIANVYITLLLQGERSEFSGKSGIYFVIHVCLAPMHHLGDSNIGKGLEFGVGPLFDLSLCVI